MEGIFMKERWIGKMEMLSLLDTVLEDLTTVEQKISTKIDEVVSSYEHSQKEALQSIEHTILEIEKVTMELQQETDRNDWKSSAGEVILHTV
jgi:hypothetical protein